MYQTDLKAFLEPHFLNTKSYNIIDTNSKRARHIIKAKIFNQTNNGDDQKDGNSTKIYSIKHAVILFQLKFIQYLSNHISPFLFLTNGFLV